MKKILFSILFISVAAFFAAGCTAAKNTGTAVGEGTKEAAEQVSGATTDASITAAVKMKMADDPLVSASKIDVDTEDGNVTLNGTVKSAAEEQKAIDLAKSVDGVKNVKSNLTIAQQ
jgi:hyperosmotically inducible protein